MKPRPYSKCDFSFGAVIGRGLFGNVYHAQPAKDSNGLIVLPRDVAIKVMDKHDILKRKQSQKILRERKILTKFSQSAMINASLVPNLFMSFVDEANLYLVMELGNFGTLASYIESRQEKAHLSSQTGLSWTEVAFFSIKILDCIEFMHRHSIIHCDLKPENILICDRQGLLKVIDFGCAIDLNEGATSSIDFDGTSDYLSPEVLKGNESIDDSLEEEFKNQKSSNSKLPTFQWEYVKGIDIWAFGCILYYLYSGNSPFHSDSDYNTFEKIITYAKTEGDQDAIAMAVSQEDCHTDVFDDFRDLVCQLIRPHPKQRLGVISFDEQSLRYDAIRSHDFHTKHSFITDGVVLNQVSSQIHQDVRSTNSRLIHGSKLPFDFFE
ncbi:hypothetical protein CTEN210_01574 [Chaetoceros tenuissimus]|uniref:non-specific serine/threonine protein kinase n=1 Tax=Chaetoceros tenuissimus TaxID=426638 RepID=A0AAD3CH81_9STRA|nr:hypothetical protein CTEN210_01574 [Chaetoceros tenuissimus]